MEGWSKLTTHMTVEKRIDEGDGERCDQVIIGFESKSCALKCPPTSFSGIKSCSSLRRDLIWVFVVYLYFLWCRDEDMQSLASLMSMKQADIGNLDDFEEENEEDEENKVNQEEKAAKITGDKHK